MNSVEVSKLLRSVFVCYPTFKNWFDELPSKNETYQQWTKVLAGAEYAVCLGVLDDWTTGRLEVPAGFQREQMIYRLAKEAKDRVAERARRAESEQLRASVTRESYVPLPRFEGSMKEAYEKILSRLPEFKAGRMTVQQWNDWCKQCAHELVK